MRTDDLIRSMAQDNVVDAQTPRRAAAFAYPLCAAALVVLFLVFLGPRPEFAAGDHLLAVGMKLGITLTLAGAAVAAVLKTAEPDADMNAGWRAAVPAAALLACAIILDFARHGADGWQARFLGDYGPRCFTYVCFLSLLPLAAALYVLRRGAVTRPTLAGVVAGLAATGIGGSFYALNCIDDSPLFILAWYTPAALLMMAFGVLGAHRLLRW